jgi:hypothetical protein
MTTDNHCDLHFSEMKEEPGRNQAPLSFVGRCPLWVHRVTLTVGWPLPVYPDQTHRQTVPACRVGANFRLPHALQATLLRRVVPAPQRCATHFLWP